MTTVPRYDDLPERYWDYLPRGTRLLDRDLSAGGGGGLSELPAGTVVAVRPNEQGTWAGVLTERIPGAVYWWQRALTPSTNAPIPQYVDGYVDGDMVDPLNEGEALPRIGIIWSDSLVTSSNADLAGRAVDNYAGGTHEGAWTSTKFDAAANGRARCMSGVGLDLYDAAVANIAPDPGVLDNYRVGIDLLMSGTGYYGGLNIRGDSLTNRTLGVWCRGTGAGTVTWSVRGWAPENWQPTITLGDAPYTAYARATITVQGDRITVEHGGTTLTHTLSAANNAMTKQVAFASGRFGEFKGRNVRFEAI